MNQSLQNTWRPAPTTKAFVPAVERRHRRDTISSKNISSTQKDTKRKLKGTSPQSTRPRTVSARKASKNIRRSRRKALSPLARILRFFTRKAQIDVLSSSASTKVASTPSKSCIPITLNLRFVAAFRTFRHKKARFAARRESANYSRSLYFSRMKSYPKRPVARKLACYRRLVHFGVPVRSVRYAHVLRAGLAPRRRKKIFRIIRAYLYHLSRRLRSHTPRHRRRTRRKAILQRKAAFHHKQASLRKMALRRKIIGRACAKVFAGLLQSQCNHVSLRGSASMAPFTRVSVVAALFHVMQLRRLAVSRIFRKARWPVFAANCYRTLSTLKSAHFELFQVSAGGGRSYALARAIPTAAPQYIRYAVALCKQNLLHCARLAAREICKPTVSPYTPLISLRRTNQSKYTSARKFIRAVRRLPKVTRLRARLYAVSTAKYPAFARRVAFSRARIAGAQSLAASQYWQQVSAMRRPLSAPKIVLVGAPSTLGGPRLVCQSPWARANSVLAGFQPYGWAAPRKRVSATRLYGVAFKKQASRFFQHRKNFTGLSYQQMSRTLTIAERPVDLCLGRPLSQPVPPISTYSWKGALNTYARSLEVLTPRCKRRWSTYRYVCNARSLRKFNQSQLRPALFRRIARQARFIGRRLHARQPRITYVYDWMRTFISLHKDSQRALRRRLHRRVARRRRRTIVRRVLRRAIYFRKRSIHYRQHQVTRFIRRHAVARSPRSERYRFRMRLISNCYAALPRSRAPLRELRRSYGSHQYYAQLGRFLLDTRDVLRLRSRNYNLKQHFPWELLSKAMHVRPWLHRYRSRYSSVYRRGLYTHRRLIRSSYLRRFAEISSRRSEAFRAPSHLRGAPRIFAPRRCLTFRRILATARRTLRTGRVSGFLHSIRQVQPRPYLRYFVAPRCGGKILTFSHYQQLLRGNRRKKMHLDSQVRGRVYLWTRRPRYAPSVLHSPAEFPWYKSRAPLLWGVLTRRQTTLLMVSRLLRLRRTRRARLLRRMRLGRTSKWRRVFPSRRKRRQLRRVKRRLKFRKRQRRRWWRTVPLCGRHVRRRHYRNIRKPKKIFRRRLRIARTWKRLLRPLYPRVRRSRFLLRRRRRCLRVRWPSSRRPFLDRGRRYRCRARALRRRYRFSRVLRRKLRHRRAACRLLTFARHRRQLEKYCPVRIYKKAPVRLAFRSFVAFTNPARFSYYALASHLL